MPGTGPVNRPLAALADEAKQNKCRFISQTEELAKLSPLSGSRAPPTDRPGGRSRRFRRRGAHPGPVLRTWDQPSGKGPHCGARFQGRRGPREAAEGRIPPWREGDD
jgi:hypothetical protein